MKPIQIAVLFSFCFLLIFRGSANALSIMPNPFQYDGEYQDTGTPFLYLNARFLNQALGMAYFITRDYGEAREEKTLFDGDYNAFAANPVMNEDPSGHGIVPSRIAQDAFDHVLAQDDALSSIGSLFARAEEEPYNEALQAAAGLFGQAEQESLNTVRLIGDTVYIPRNFLAQELRFEGQPADMDERFSRDYGEYMLSMHDAGEERSVKLIRDREKPARYMTAIGRFSRNKLFDSNLTGLILGYTDFQDFLPDIIKALEISSENDLVNDNIINNGLFVIFQHI